MTSLVGGVERVDKRVDSGTVSAGRNAAKLLADRVVRGKSGSIGVVLEVTVGRVVGVDERVEVGVNRGINIVIVNRSSLLDRGGLLNDRGSLLNDRSSLLGVEGGRVESVGSGGDMRAVEDPEPVLASCVLHGVSPPIVPNIAVLTDTLASCSSLLPEHNPVLLSEGGSESSVPGIEPLFFQDLGILRVNKLTSSSGCQA